MLNPEGNKRIDEFKSFENYFYTGFDCTLKSSNFHSTYKVNIDGNIIGIASLNSSWRCYDSQKDKGVILIGEQQIIDSLHDLRDCGLKIALSHHHYDWLKEFDSEIVEVLLKQDFNMYFTGHTHKTKVSYTQDPDGKMFSFCSSGTLTSNVRKPENKYENGFSIIDYDEKKGQLQITFYKGEYPKKNFILNTSIGDNGVWTTNIPIGDEVQKIIFEQTLIKQINSEALPLINSHLLTYSTDTNAPKALDDIFVMPNLVFKEEFDAEKASKSVDTLEQIITCDKNYIFFGTKESGKTTLLDRILVETLNTNKVHHQIPAIIDFKELKDNVIKLIKEYWNKPTEETQRIINEYKILLLIDNITFDDEDVYKLKTLSLFLAKNPNVRFLATYQQLYEDDYPLNLQLVSLFNFTNITLKQFKTRQIKQLIQKWFPNSDRFETPRKLETLTNAFLALNLPRTPFAVSMFLWIIEKQENFKPINNSTLIENFIERLLKKHDANESLREKFGYDNKIWIISYLAYNMLNEDNTNYSLGYAEFVSLVDQYLKSKKFEDFTTDKIVDMLLDSGIFLRENGDVRFRFTCFFEFFLMKRMEKDSTFKEFILREENFLRFGNEIDYFTGIHRGETEVLKLIISRLEDGFQDVQKLINDTLIERKYKNYDGFFINKNEKGEEKPSLASQLHEDKVINFLPSNKPTEEDLEVMEDDRLELQQQEKGITKKEKGHKIKDLSKLLVLSLKAVKNSEEVEDENNKNLKLDNYTTVLNKSILFAILHKAIFELYIQDEDKKLSAEKIEEFKKVSQFLPLLHEVFLFDNVGTQKLTAVIREKINLDKDKTKKISDFEKSLSVFLYSDIRGRDYDKILSDFIKTVETKYIEDVIFFKLITYYFYRSKDAKTDNFYLNLIADLVIKSRGYNKNKKSRIMDNYKRKKIDRLNQDKKN